MKDEIEKLAEAYVNFFDDFVVTEDRIEDSYVCDCNTNYGGRCLFPEKYRTIGCNGKGE